MRGDGPALACFFEHGDALPDGLQRVDTSSTPSSPLQVCPVSGNRLLSLSGRLVNLGDAVKAVGDKGAGTPNTLTALPVGKRVFSPTDEPAVELQGFLSPVQHIKRSCVIPDGERAIRLNMKRLQLVL